MRVERLNRYKILIKIDRGIKMLENIKWLGHSTIKFIENKIIYIDPYNLDEQLNDADIIFITHNHYDHFSSDDIKKCMKDDTKIVITLDLYNDVLALGFKEENIMKVLPNNNYKLDDINFETIPSYNPNKNFHPKENNWVGYIITINNVSYYIAGDTDITEEAKKVKCDVAFLPVGGKFTMDYKEASELANIINPKLVVPIHYATIIGTIDDAINFKDNLKNDIECEIL